MGSESVAMTEIYLQPSRCVCCFEETLQAIGHLVQDDLPFYANSLHWSLRTRSEHVVMPVASFDSDNTLTSYRDMMRDGRERLRTFVEGRWPISSPQSPLELSEAGFYYTGKNDLVHCAFCQLIVSCWSRGDNPVWEHFKHAPNGCGFIQGRDVGNVPIYEDPIRGDNLSVLYFDIVENSPDYVYNRHNDLDSSEDESQNIERFDSENNA